MGLIVGDCLTEMIKLNDKSINCVITSPPYNIGLSYNTYNDKRDDYREFLNNVFIQIERVLTDDGHFFLNISPTRQDPFFAYKVASWVPMKCQNPIVWAKSIEIDNKIRGHGNSSFSSRYLSRGWEMMWHFTKDGKQPINLRVPYAPQWAEGNTKRSGRTDRVTTDCWHVGYETIGSFGKTPEEIQGDKKHPAIYPRDLVRRCLTMSNAKHVLDPFAGTGTTGVVAKEMGIDYTLIEIDKDYCDFIEQRLK